MDGLRISEVAAQTGFSAPTLRYYEAIGVLPAAPRTDGGYRLYDDRTVDLLRFVARAKALGLTLEETRELAGLWSGDQCRPVKERLIELVHDKLGAARAQLVELDAFAAQLEFVASNLAQHDSDGPCDDQCGCSGDVAMGNATDAPIACTLEDAEVGPRLAAWRALLAHKDRVVEIADGVRVRFDGAVTAADVAQLAQDEHACCSFLSFAVLVDRDGVGLDVRAAAEARPVIDVLLGVSD
jgi:DNA-binding transcriptional MerR regulator